MTKFKYDEKDRCEYCRYWRPIDDYEKDQGICGLDGPQTIVVNHYVKTIYDITCRDEWCANGEWWEG